MALYPLYYTGECIRSWDKAKKVHFQKLCVIWMIYFTFLILRDALYYFLAYFYILSVYDIVAVGSILFCYTSLGTTYMRTFVILPSLRELRRKIYPTVKKFLEILLTKVSDYIASKAVFNRLYDENSSIKVIDHRSSLPLPLPLPLPQS